MDSVDDQNRAWRDAEQQEFLKKHPVESSQFMRIMKKIKAKALPEMRNHFGAKTIRIDEVRKILKEEL